MELPIEPEAASRLFSLLLREVDCLGFSKDSPNYVVLIRGIRNLLPSFEIFPPTPTSSATSLRPAHAPPATTAVKIEEEDHLIFEPFIKSEGGVEEHTPGGTGTEPFIGSEAVSQLFSLLLREVDSLGFNGSSPCYSVLMRAIRNIIPTCEISPDATATVKTELEEQQVFTPFIKLEELNDDHQLTSGEAPPVVKPMEECSNGSFSEDTVIRERTVTRADKTFVCSWDGCSKTFTNKFNLTRHTKTHTGDKPFKCSWEGCGRAFSQRSDLKAHDRFHTGDKPLKCSWEGCSRYFSRRYGLKVHERTHTGDKPFKCSWEGCGRYFSRRDGVKVHERAHTGDKPFNCFWEGCGRAFSDRSSWNRHQRVHTGDKPFKCSLEGCTKAFRQAYYLNVHMRTHTPSAAVQPL